MPLQARVEEPEAVMMMMIDDAAIVVFVGCLLMKMLFFIVHCGGYSYKSIPKLIIISFVPHIISPHNP